MRLCVIPQHQTSEIRTSEIGRHCVKRQRQEWEILATGPGGEKKMDGV